MKPFPWSLAATVCAAAVLAMTAWQQQGGPAPAPAGLPETATAAATRPQPEAAAETARRIAGMHLFGLAPRAPRAAEALPRMKVAPPPPTLTLRGVLRSHSGPPRNDIAILADAAGRERTYRVGDMVAGVGELRVIGRDGVLIDLPGGQHRIALAEPAGGADRMVLAAPTPQTAPAVLGDVQARLAGIARQQQAAHARPPRSIESASSLAASRSAAEAQRARLGFN